MSRSVELIKQAMSSNTLHSDSPECNSPKTTERTPNEALSEGAEKAHVEGNIDALSEYMASTGDTRKHDKGIISQLFEHGKPGKYVTRSKTLIEKVSHVLKK